MKKRDRFKVYKEMLDSPLWDDRNSFNRCIGFCGVLSNVTKQLRIQNDRKWIAGKSISKSFYTSDIECYPELMKYKPKQGRMWSENFWFSRDGSYGVRKRKNILREILNENTRSKIRRVQ